MDSKRTTQLVINGNISPVYAFKTNLPGTLIQWVRFPCPNLPGDPSIFQITVYRFIHCRLIILIIPLVFLKIHLSVALFMFYNYLYEKVSTQAK